MGSLWVRHGGVSFDGSEKDDDVVVVCTPSRVWSEFPDYYVYCGNGLAPSPASTLIVPHYGVWEAGGPAVSTPDAPPTFIYGKYATFCQTILASEGILVEIVDDYNTIQRHARRKLVWASTLWLLCAAHGGITVGKVLEDHNDELASLVFELVQDDPAIMDYITGYSLSQAHVTPSRELAFRELDQRNGVFLRTQQEQPLCWKLLHDVGVVVEDLYERVAERSR